jgi:cell division protease FtsH
MQFPNDDDKNRSKRPDPDTPPTPPEQPDWQRWVVPFAIIALVTLMISQMLGSGTLGTQGMLTYSELVREAENGNIANISIRSQSATGSLTNPIENSEGQTITNFRLNLPADQRQLQEAFATGNVLKVNYESTETSPLLFILMNIIIPFALIVGLLMWFMRRAQRQMGNTMNFGRTQAREYTVERPQVTFKDVAGQEPAKRELVEIVDFLREPDKFIALGARIPRGVLLIGPPGTGKTLLARAVAGEANVSFFSIAASEFVEMFVGVGASRVRDLFRKAKENAPSIVFIDEIDAVGRQRGAGLGGGHDEREQTLNQMLAEMDGFDQTESVIVMAATNRNDVLDPALLRPGRFDRQVTVGLPDRHGRHEILKIHTRGKPLDSLVNLEALAKGTIGFSGADLSNLANEAALNAARRNGRKISMRDFSDAFDRIVLGTERPPLSDPKERRVIAYHESGHVLTSLLVPEADPVLKVTIVPRGQALGVAAYMPDDDRRNYPYSYLMARMYSALGGRAAEQIVFGEVTTGAESDLRYVTDIARRMVSQWGMSEDVGQVNFGDNDRQPFLGYSMSQSRNYSEETASKIDAAVAQIIREAYEHTLQLLETNRSKLDALAEQLLVQEVIERDEILRIVGMTPDDKVGHFSNKPDGLSNGVADEPITPEIVDDEDVIIVPPSEPDQKQIGSADSE